MGECTLNSDQQLVGWLHDYTFERFVKDDDTKRICFVTGCIQGQLMFKGIQPTKNISYCYRKTTERRNNLPNKQQSPALRKRSSALKSADDVTDCHAIVQTVH